VARSHTNRTPKPTSERHRFLIDPAALRFIRSLYIQGEGMDPPLHLGGEASHDEAVTGDQWLSIECFGNHRCVPVVLGPGQVAELDLGVREDLADAGDDLFGVHRALTPAPRRAPCRRWRTPRRRGRRPGSSAPPRAGPGSAPGPW